MKYIHYTTATIATIAERIAETISVRTCTNGNSHDERRATTADESHAIFAVAFGTLANLNYRILGIGENYGSSHDDEISTMMQTARDTAEWVIDELVTLPDGQEVNGYNTVYCPIWAMSEYLWNGASDFTKRYLDMLHLSEDDFAKFDEVVVD